MSETRADYHIARDKPDSANQLSLPLGTVDPAPETDVDQQMHPHELAIESPHDPRRELEGAIAEIVSATDVPPPLVYQVIGMAMAALHKNALTNEQKLHGLLHDCYWAFGLETAFHLGGILEEAHRDEPNEGWSETISLLRPREEWEPIQATVEQWLGQRPERRRAFDQVQQDLPLDRAILDLKHHPEINSNGLTFLESLLGRPTLARDLFRNGTLLQTVLDRQRMAEEYAEHAVLELGQDPRLAQREAEREFLLLPDEATAPDLNSQDCR